MKLEDFKLRSDGDDWSPAMERCIAESHMSRDVAIEVPIGFLRFSRPIEFTAGTLLRGSGGCPSNIGQGTVLSADFDTSPFLTWNGKNSCLGTGGGLDSIVLAAAKGRKTGPAILLTGNSATNRAGEIDIRRVTVYSGSDAGNFNVGLRVDGRLINVVGSAGVRGVTVSACKFAGCILNAVELLNAVHFYGQFQTAAATNGTGDVLVDNLSEDVQMFGTAIYGTLTLNACKDVFITGYLTKLVRTELAKQVFVAQKS